MSRRTLRELCVPALMIAALILVSGCATIVSGTTQNVRINSSPGDAKVSVNDSELGRTPLTVELRRKDIHRVRIEHEGFRPYEYVLDRAMNPWLWVDILVFNGVLPMAVDYMSGAMWKLEPGEINPVLEEVGPEADTFHQTGPIGHGVISPEPRTDAGLIYFYRNKVTLLGALGTVDILDGDRGIGDLRNGTYLYHWAEPGRHVFVTENRVFRISSKIGDHVAEIEPGKTYYLRATADRPLIPMPEHQAKEHLPRLRFVGTE